MDGVWVAHAARGRTAAPGLSQARLLSFVAPASRSMPIGFCLEKPAVLARRFRGSTSCPCLQSAMLQNFQTLAGAAAMQRVTLALNHVLSSEPVAAQRLRPHAGRSI